MKKLTTVAGLAIALALLVLGGREEREPSRGGRLSHRREGVISKG